jgi:methanogenic corrinoid protein MtbC1
MATDSSNSPTGEVAYRRFLDGLLLGDRAACRAIFQDWLDASPDLISFYHDLVQRSLYEVGEMWERGQISVATEHLATAITEGLLNLVYPRLFASPRTGNAAVVACVADEFHQIGGKIVADVFELHGWRGYFLGANTPIADTCALIEEKKPQVVVLSLTVAMGMEKLLDAIKILQVAAPQTPILVGGQAFRWGGKQRLEPFVNVSYLESLDELVDWITARQKV